MPPPLHESQLLKPKNPAILDNNQWPDFPLTQAEVFDASTGQPTSLLFADVTTPLTVVGKLERLPHDRLPCLLPRASLPAAVEITNVHTFSYGQYEEGEVALWAAGEAGWFEIKPSRAYRAIFKDMVEAVNLLYFTADFHRDLDRTRLRKVSAESVFENYAEDASHKCKDAERAIGMFKKHRRFLVASMRTGKEGISWKQTLIFEYLQRELDDVASSEDGTHLAETPTGYSQEAMDENDPARLAKQGKSALRPRSSKHSMKGAGRRLQPDEVSGDTPSKADESPTRRSSLLKRKNASRHSGASNRRRKRDKTAAAEETLPSPSEDEATMTDHPLPLLNVARLARPREKQSMIHIIEEALPSCEPQGPGDTWTCTFDGCCHRVYGASTPQSRDLIKEHYRGHGFNAQAQMDLVYKEERPYLPVGNLLKKIRDLAAQSRSVSIKEELQGWPKPIETKY